MTGAFFGILLSLLFATTSDGSIKTAGPNENSSAKEKVRILCYNIRNGVGMDDQVRYDRIVGVIKNIKPHVAALQELDSATERSRGVDVLGHLAEQTGMFATYGAAIDYRGGKYGVGVLTREKPVRTYTVPLPGTEEKRVLLVVELSEMVLFCTHLSLTEKDRIASVAIINGERRKFKKPVFLAGDLNDQPQSASIGALKQEWQVLSGDAPTYPADTPDRCIDYIFGARQKPYKVKENKVVAEPVASDHRPLYVDVQ